MLDVYTNMPCVFINTAQEFPNYGKMLYEEEILKVTEIVTPIAKFGENGNEQGSSISSEYKSTSDLDLILPEDEDENAMGTPSTQTNVQEIGPIIGKSKTVYNRHSGICIRPQLYPDAVTHVNIIQFNIIHQQK